MRKTTWLIALFAILLTVGCTQQSIEPTEEGSLAMDTSVEVSTFMFKTDAGAEHYEYVNAHIEGICQVPTMIKSGFDDTAILSAVLLDDIALYDKYYSLAKSEHELGRAVGDWELAKMMEAGIEPVELFCYMDKSGVRSDENEIFIGSYVALHGRLSGIPINWTMVGTMDVVAAGISTPLGGGVCSVGVIVGHIIKAAKNS